MKNSRILIYLSILFQFVSSAMILLMPYASNELYKGNQWISILVGGMFWGALIASYVLLIIANQSRRKDRMKRGGNLEKKQQLHRVGMLCFGSNVEAIYADLSCALAVLTLIVILVKTNFTGYICFVFISITFFLLHLRGILNGRNYCYSKMESAKPNL